jgi:hypothetical protein
MQSHRYGFVAELRLLFCIILERGGDFRPFCGSGILVAGYTGRGWKKAHFSTDGGGISFMNIRKLLCALLFSCAFAVGAMAQQSGTVQRTKEKAGDVKDRAVAAGQVVGDKTMGGARAAGSGIKVVAGETAEKTVEAARTARSAGAEVADKVEDGKDKAAKGVRVAGNAAGAVGERAADTVRSAGAATKSAGAEVGDKAEDAKDQTVKAAKKSGNWLSRTFRKIF